MNLTDKFIVACPENTLPNNSLNDSPSNYGGSEFQPPEESNLNQFCGNNQMKRC